MARLGLGDWVDWATAQRAAPFRHNTQHSVSQMRALDLTFTRRLPTPLGCPCMPL